jgi:hypothetical protein
VGRIIDSTKFVFFEDPECINFIIENDEIIKICADGKFIVKGKEVTEDDKLYDAFVEFFKDSGYY